VYLLSCSDSTYYSGHMDNLEKRLGEHRAGFGADYTARRRPVQLVWCEVLPTRDEAFAFERRIKGWSRAKKEALIGRDWDRVRQLAWSTERQERHARPERRLAEPKSKGAEVEQRPSTTLRFAQDERNSDPPTAPPLPPAGGELI
jgi:predicted GIY-YIG superfamily endonuclease